MSYRVTLAMILGAALAVPSAGWDGHRHRGGCGHGHGHCAGECAGCRSGAGQGRGSRQEVDFQKDREMFHFLLDNRERIRREVAELPDGVETLTESEDPEIVAGIREHVAAMHARLEEGRPIHRRDPLFDELFGHADAIEMEIEETEGGLRVRETSEDPYVASLIKEHAKVVSAFLENGRDEVRRDHPLPAGAAPSEAQ